MIFHLGYYAGRTTGGGTTPPTGGGPPTKGLMFPSGSNIKIEVTNLAGLPAGSKTVSFWIRRPANWGTKSILKFGMGNGLSFEPIIIYNNYGNHIYGNSAEELMNGSNTIVEDGLMEFVSYTIQNGSGNSQWTLFRDAVQKSTYTHPAEINTATNTNELLIGSGLYNNSAIALADVQIWDTVRTPTQLLADMNGIPNPTAEPNLKAYFKLQSGPGNVTEDSGKTCTITVAPEVSDYTF